MTTNVNATSESAYFKGKTFKQLSKDDFKQLLRIEIDKNERTNNTQALAALEPIVLNVVSGKDLTQDTKAVLERILSDVQKSENAAVADIDSMAGIPDDKSATEPKEKTVQLSYFKDKTFEQLSRDDLKQLLLIEIDANDRTNNTKALAALKPIVDNVASGNELTSESKEVLERILSDVKEKEAVQKQIIEYGSLLKEQPNLPHVYRARAGAYITLGEFDKALTDYNTAIDLEPNNPYNYSERGRILEKLNRLEDAINDYEKARDLFKGKGIKGFYLLMQDLIGKLNKQLDDKKTQELKATEKEKEKEEVDDNSPITGIENIHQAMEDDIRKGTSKVRRISDEDLIAYFATSTGCADIAAISTHGKSENAIYVISKFNDMAAIYGIPERICGVQLFGASAIQLADPTSMWTWAPHEINRSDTIYYLREAYDKDFSGNLSIAVQSMAQKLMQHIRSAKQ